MTSKDIRAKYIKFFTSRGHVQISPAKLVPENDPTTLFTSSGMQPLVPYLLGQEHPGGKRLVDSQPSFRAEDIEEIGDNRHTTFFEMLGNWSLGDYFKEQQLEYIFSFLLDEVKLDATRLYWTLFKGLGKVPKDTESRNILKEKLFRSIEREFFVRGIKEVTVNEDPEKGIKETDRIFYYTNKNWWSRSGSPDKMPVGEIGGPDVEVFYDFGKELRLHENSIFKERECHPNCDCGRFMEICNSVFIEFQKQGDGGFLPLKQQNVDFGGGLERITAASINDPDVFQTDLYLPIIRIIEQMSGKKYQENAASMRVIADHMKSATFLIRSGVYPSNKLQGYVLRRLLRRSMVKLNYFIADITEQKNIFGELVDRVISIYDEVDNVVGIYDEKKYYGDQSDEEGIKQIVWEELDRFKKTLAQGLKEIEKIEKIDGKIAFDLYQTFGFPYEVTEELFRQKGQEIDREQFRAEFEKHRELSRTASVGMFKGGLADHSEVTVKYHTATHLLHQALRDVLGESVFQKGSNITSERLRFDFSFDRKMTEEEIKSVEDIINVRIKQDLEVDRMIIPIEKAKAMNAIGLFNDKYAQEVSIYGVGPDFKLQSDAKDQRIRGGYYSLEFCGGPHVENTGSIGSIKITKEEAISAGIRRIRVVLVN